MFTSEKVESELPRNDRTFTWEKVESELPRNGRTCWSTECMRRLVFGAGDPFAYDKCVICNKKLVSKDVPFKMIKFTN